MKATSGSVEVQGRIASLLELGAGFNPELTGRENVFLNAALMMIPERETRESIDDIRTFADIGEYFDQPVKHYSSGMFARLAFSSAIHVNPDVFIVDEALSVGDAGFQNRCFEKIQNFISQGKTMLFVSHNTDQLLKVCDRGIVLHDGKVECIGHIKTAVQEYENLISGAVYAKNRPAVDTKAERARELKTPFDRLYAHPNYNTSEFRMGSRKAEIFDCDVIVNSVANLK